MKSASKKIVRAAALLMGLQFLDEITGLLKQILIAGNFGTSAMMDGYLVAMTVVGLVITFVRLPITQTVIPMFRHDFAQRGERAAWTNFSILFNNLVLGLILLAVAGWILAPYAVGLIAPGFEKETGALATSLARITMASIVFLGIARILTQIFLSYERFFIPGIAGCLDNVVVILGVVVLTSVFGIYGLAIAVLLGAASRFTLKLPILWQNRSFLSRKIKFHDPATFEMARLSVPLFLSTSGAELAKITDRIFASLLPGGSLSALAYGRKLVIAPVELFLQPLQKSTFPHFTKLTAEGNFEVLSRQLSRYLRSVLFVVLPAALGIMVMPEVIVRVIYQRGAFDETSTLLTSQAFFFYSIGLPAIPICRILNRIFFGMKDTWTPTKLSLFSIGVKIMLAWTLISPLGHRGIALAESVSEIIRAFLLLAFLPGEVKGADKQSFLKSFRLTLAGSGFMVAVVYGAKERIAGFFGAPSELLALVVLGFVSYGVITFFFQREELRTLLNAVGSLMPKTAPSKS